MKWLWIQRREQQEALIEQKVAEGVAAGVAAARSEIQEELCRGFVERARESSSYSLIAQVPNISPQHGSPYPLYGMDRPIWYATPNSPRRRPDSLIDIDTLRRFANTYDVLRSCINHLKREVQAQPFSIAPRDKSDKSDALKKRIEDAKSFFTKRGGLGEINQTRRHYESKIFEDILVIGCYAVWKNKNAMAS